MHYLLGRVELALKPFCDISSEITAVVSDEGSWEQCRAWGGSCWPTAAAAGARLRDASSELPIYNYRTNSYTLQAIEVKNCSLNCMSPAMPLGGPVSPPPTPRSDYMKPCLLDPAHSNTTCPCSTARIQRRINSSPRR